MPLSQLPRFPYQWDVILRYSLVSSLIPYWYHFLVSGFLSVPWSTDLVSECSFLQNQKLKTIVKRLYLMQMLGVFEWVRVSRCPFLVDFPFQGGVCGRRLVTTELRFIVNVYVWAGCCGRQCVLLMACSRTYHPQELFSFFWSQLFQVTIQGYERGMGYLSARLIYLFWIYRWFFFFFKM